MKYLIGTVAIAFLLLFVSCSDDSDDMPTSGDLILTELNGNAYKNSSESLVVYFENNLLIVANSKVQHCWKTTALNAQILSQKSNEVIYNVTEQAENFTFKITGSKSGIILRMTDGEKVETYSLSPTDDCIV